MASSGSSMNFTSRRGSRWDTFGLSCASTSARDLTFHGTSSCLAFGIGAVTSYKELARYSDLRQLRYDESLFFVSPLLIELLCATRKNNQEFSTRLAVARPADPNEFGVYNALILGKTIFGGGYIMPHIDSLGVVHRERPMEYGDYVRFLREGLISATGTAESEDLLYAGQSARSGAGSSPTRGQIWRKDARRHSSGHSSSRSGPPRPLRGLCSCCLGSCVYLGGVLLTPRARGPRHYSINPWASRALRGEG